jgi:hypothetical protein
MAVWAVIEGCVRISMMCLVILLIQGLYAALLALSFCAVWCLDLPVPALDLVCDAIPLCG